MKALFFLRHYNDIDHVTPVIYKWVNSGHTCDIVLIGNSRFRNDYRIEFLRKLNGVRMAYISDLLPPIEFARWFLQTLILIRSLRRPFIGPIMAAIAKSYDARRRAPVWHSTAQRLLARSFGDAHEGVVVFDWIERNSSICVEWVGVMLSTARAMGLGTVSLPHGDSPHASQLIRRRELRLEPDTTFANAGIFDKVVVPNELCSVRFRPFMDNQKLAVLGSPRYCDEWLAKLATLMPPSPLTRSGSRLKVVLFLRKSNFSTFWEEVGEVVRVVAGFPGVELIIKPHTRGGWQQSLTRDASLRRLPNVSVAGDIHSIHLMNWADVIIDLATSVVFEAVKAKKPVLAGDYLHAGRSALAEYLPETELRCRDDVYRQIEGFLTHGCDNFYIEAHHQRFVKEMINVGDADVLSRYVALLEEQGRARTSQGQPYPDERAVNLAFG
ncbi:hypothetical protein [Nitrosospira sp. NpAV]|uniref:hypothetical protein n=1 Tax=Nitrosospira sp. NpAV TaxID=58133 RepID=UPI0005A0BC04|nr:hypothetical protein [Nitrosospira sp. NpAV]KIO48892.1 hypothetical protein SQ11_08895 [Nitrosospira sp. NpAV]